MSDSPFSTFLEQGQARGGFEVNDALAAVLPLMREVQAIHDLGKVAPLRGLSAITIHEDRALGLTSHEGIDPKSNAARVYELLAPLGHGVQVIGEHRRESDDEHFGTRVTNLDVGNPGDEVTRPLYLPGHIAWEHEIGHHDALTDIHSLGLLLASLACGLDFTDREDLERFANARSNLFALSLIHI